MAGAAATASRAGFRTDLEGLRAVAILAVLGFHAAVPRMGGGFVGVDVFFVLSGFLITGQLLASLRRTGRVSLRDFYARRARRILPAAGVTLLAVLAASWLLLPPLRRQDVAGDVLAAALYVPNWRFIGQQVDYSSAGLAPSPVLHYWSLGVEEQFYLLWPALLLGLTWLGWHRRRWSATLITGAVVAGSVVSYLAAAHATTVEQPWAYLSTPARAWQFGAGAAVALLGWVAAGREPWDGLPWLRAALGWGGLLAIEWSIIGFTSATPYPGSAALIPTLGAAAVIASGAATDGAGGLRASDRAGWGPHHLLSTAPVRAVGRLSFSWYLWHWPVLILAEALHPDLPWPVKLAVVLASAIPAWLTMRLVERPIRFSPALLAGAGRPLRRSLAVGAAAMLLPATAGVATTLASAWQMHQAVRSHPTLVAAAPTARSPFGDTGATGGAVTPAPQQARGDYPQYPPECNVAPSVVVSPRCVLGGSPGAPHVVLLGDSHAGQWYPAVRRIADEHGWSTEVLVKGGCPLPAFPFVSPWLGRPFTECDQWRANTLRRLASEPAPVMVLFSTLNRYIPDPNAVFDGWQPVLRALTALHVPVIYLHDNPYPDGDPPACISGSLANWSACDFNRDDAEWPDPLATAISDGTEPGVREVDLTWALCPPGPPTCPVVQGGTLLYRDYSHMTNTAATKLTPALEHALTQLGVLHPPPAH